jgi:hypothetical protein
MEILRDGPRSGDLALHSCPRQRDNGPARPSADGSAGSLFDQVNGAGMSIDEGRVDHSLKFSNAAGSAGVRKLLARNNSVSREHKTFDAVNFLCA